MQLKVVNFTTCCNKLVNNFIRCNKSVKIRLVATCRLLEFVESNQLTTSLFSTWNRFALNKLLQVMQNAYRIGIITKSVVCFAGKWDSMHLDQNLVAKNNIVTYKDKNKQERIIWDMCTMGFRQDVGWEIGIGLPSPFRASCICLLHCSLNSKLSNLSPDSHPCWFKIIVI